MTISSVPSATPCSSLTDTTVQKNAPRHKTQPPKGNENDKALLYVAFGSNEGNREQLIAQAAQRLGERIGRLIKLSALYETEPEGFVSENLFMNAAAAYETSLKASKILGISQEIERELGRRQKSRDGIYHDRSIDIDLLWKSDETVDSPLLTLPHPRMKERLFVMEPFAEIAPLLSLDGESIESLAQRLKER
ncbi:MAG: 2-amino-4-hydroxy-6-hydroxymethyldihydropteridine diphosphokinase [Alloprevotella sp.]|nr:2-amino-4-hydroxy-6-hydroxymethyldihydropteridine diphosphokinase [Alloprevotella sp.]